MQKTLTNTTEIDVKFNQVDSLGIVWHGHYISYFEDGREAFGKQYGISYLTIYQNKYVTPIVSVNCEYKKFLRYGDRVVIETTYTPSNAAKLHFSYRLFNVANGELIVTGSTLQVFLNSDNLTLELTNPLFFEVWKKQYGLT